MLNASYTTVSKGFIYCCEFIQIGNEAIRLIAFQSYDYTLEKVKLYTRVPLGDIVSITRGPLQTLFKMQHLNMA